METEKKCDFCRKHSYKKRILVTGGAGFIGSHVVILLVERYPEYFVVNLDKLDYCASLKNLRQIQGKPNYKFIEGDVCEANYLKYIFQAEQIDTVMHFAAQSHVDNSFWSSLDFTKNNVYGTHVLINVAHEAKVKRFIHVSTDEVYGGDANAEQPNIETSPLRPSNPYAASKAAAECIVMSYLESFKFPVIVTRSNNVYGPHKYPETVIPKFISLLHQDRKCFIHGDGKQERNFLYVSDVAEAFDEILHKGQDGETYNVGSDFAINILDLARELITKMKGKCTGEEIQKYIEFVEDRPFNDKRYPMDSSKVRALGWEPKVSWEEGLQKTIDWYTDPAAMNKWPSAELALRPFPIGSNTKYCDENGTLAKPLLSPSHSPDTMWKW